MERSKRNTKSVGDRSEIEVMAALVRAGHLVSIPFGENHRYDLISDKDGVLSRIQVKTGRLREGVISFNPWSAHSHRNGPSCRPYGGEIEFFAVYCPEVDATFVVPVGEVRMSGSLRWTPTKNGQSVGVRWASSFILSSGKPAASVGARGGGEVPSPDVRIALPL